MSKAENGPTILGTRPQPQRIGRTTTALKLPLTPSAAFDDFTDPFKQRKKQTQRFVPMTSELTKQRFDFSTTDFIGPRGDFARNVFNIKTKKTFGPQNLPAIRRRKSLMEFEF